jgi:ribosomal protein S18 acetylase RimI-like enzyme
VNYRLYAADDFAELYAIEEACFEPPLRFGRRLMQRLVASANSATWIAEQDGRMAGFAIVEWSKTPFGVLAYIATIEVAPGMRKSGAGTELLRRVEDSARSAGASSLWLHVDAQNGPAMRLYEKNGFEQRGREENYYAPGLAALMYEKALGLN